MAKKEKIPFFVFLLLLFLFFSCPEFFSHISCSFFKMIYGCEDIFLLKKSAKRREKINKKKIYNSKSLLGI
jgi:hypothetical protein